MNKFFLKKFDMKLAIFFLFLFLFEFLLFKSYVLREVVGYYPWAFDQSGYLMNSYASYEKLLSLGIKSGLSNTALPTSIIFIPFTTLFFLFFGATRLSALLINFFFFILLQIFSISTMKWFSQRNILCVMFCAALLSIATPLLNVGSLIDFRIDFLAFCLYGIFVCTIIRSKIFLDRKWTIIVAIVTSIMILMRCITAAYFFIEISILFLIVCFCIIRTKNSIKKKDALLRFKNILWLIGTCTISTIPFLWLNRQMIHDYYIVGHLIGPEKFIRMKEQGIINLFSDLIYYPHSILCNHLGKYGIVECTILFIVGLLSFFILKKQKKIKITSNKNDFFSSPSPYFTFLVLAILVPSIILTADSSKSPVVGGIVVVPILWLFFSFFLYFGRKLLDFKFPILILTLLFFIFGSYQWINFFGKHNYISQVENARNLTKMYVDIGNYAQMVGIDDIRFSVDKIDDSTNLGDLVDLYYEETSTWLHVSSTPLGNSIFSISKDQALSGLNNADIFILHRGKVAPSPYPFDTDMITLRPILKAAAKKEFLLLGDYSYGDSDLAVYVRPTFKVSGDSGGWITNDGIVLTIPQKIFIHSSEIILSGAINPWVSKNIRVKASILNLNKTSTEIKSKLTMNTKNYTILIIPPKYAINNGNPVKIKILFTSYFVPQKIGLNQDTRKLIFTTPTVKIIKIH